MKLYRDADKNWVGTQAEAGNKDAIEVPVDKPNLILWLNSQKAPNKLEITLTPPEPSGSCAACRMTHSAARRIAEGMMMDEVAEKIMTAEGWELDRMAGAVIGRLIELKDVVCVKSST